MQTILECRNIAKSFSIRKTRRDILKGVSFSLSKGEIFVITGKSGAGKSTLLSILAGLDTPDSGQVNLFDKVVSDMDESTLALLRYEKVGFLFQNHNLIPSWTAFENIEAALAHKKISKEHISESVLSILSEVGLEGYEHHLPSELSDGEQQRVAVARALVNNPALIFADEPIADVDTSTGRRILDMLLHRVKECSTAIVFATHGIPPHGFEKKIVELRVGELQEINAVHPDTRCIS